MDSPVSNAQPTLEGAPQDAPKEAYAPLEDGILVEGSSGAEGVMAEAPLEVVVALLFSTKVRSAGPRRPRMLDQLLLSSYVPPQEWVHPSVDTVAPRLEGALEIIDR